MKTAIAIIVVLVLAGGAYLLFAPTSNAPAPTDTTTQTPSATIPEEGTPGTAVTTGVGVGAPTVTYTDSGFSPASLTVAPGTTVRFVNNSSGNMWVGADVHPTHAEYDGTTKDQHCVNGSSTSFDQCKGTGAGTTYSFTFTKVGTFGYHNHARASDTGTIIVK